MIKQIDIGTKVIHKAEKKPYKVVAGYNGVFIATRNIFGKEQYVVLDTNKNLCGHSVLMSFPRGIKGLETYYDELVAYNNGDWEISQRGIGELDKYWSVY